MDAKQIRREMIATRASIDRKLDLLSARTAETRDRTVRTATIVGAGIIVIAAWSWWQRRATTRKARRLVQLRAVGDRWPAEHSA